MKRKMNRWLSLLLTLALVVTMLPVVPGSVEAKAENATVLYIKDTQGAETTTVTEDMSVSANGWSWDADTATLTLNGFDGEYIEADNDINIVLSGTNTVTMPVDAQHGIKSNGKITIDDTISPAQDVLNVISEDATIDVEMIDCANSNIVINGGTVNLSGSAATNRLYGFGSEVEVYNDSVIDVDFTDNGKNQRIYAFYREPRVYTSGTITATVDSGSIYSMIFSSAAKKYGTGDFVLNLEKKGQIGGIVIDSTDARGTITAKGYLVIYPKRNTWKVQGYDNFLWQSWTDAEASPNGHSGYYVSDSTGAPIKDPVITYVGAQTFKMMDSVKFDIPAKKIGDSFEQKPYWTEGCIGGTGSYKFALAEDSDPLPEGVTVNSAGYFTGAPTEIHPGGTAKIKVTSGSESATFEVDYGPVGYKNPVTGVELNKNELVMAQNAEETLTASVLPDTADNLGVTWTYDDDYVGITELDKGETNQRQIRLKSYSKPGKSTVTVKTKAGSYTDVCDLYVKEMTPQAYQEKDYIKGLNSNSTYKINGVEKTSDISGRIAIEDAWRGGDITIVKINAEEKCNSDGQTLSVEKKKITDGTVTLEYYYTDYDGTQKEPSVSVKYGDDTLVFDTDYTLLYADNINAGKASVTVTGKGDYIGEKAFEFTINPLTMTGISVIGFTGDYDGNPHSVSVIGLPVDATITYSLEEDGVYSAEVPSRTMAGITDVYYKIEKENYKTITGKVSLEIYELDLTLADIKIVSNSLIYDGSAKTPAITVTYEMDVLVAGTDYTVSYSDNINAGKAKAVVTGKGNYGGTIVKEFTITPASIAGKTVTLSQVSYTYDGTAKTPTVSVAGLKQNVDYTVAYANNVNVGTATVIVTGKGNYTGGITKTFEIKEKPAPAKNTTLTDAKTGIKYKVTKAGKSGGTVEFKAPKNKKVTKVTIPATVEIDGITYKVTTIAKSAFSGCSKLKTITIGKNVTTIGDKAFYNCKALTKITIPSKVTKIGKAAFYGCKKLKNITIKTTKLKSSTVGKNAFKGTPKSAVVKVPKKSVKAYKKFLYKKGLHKKAKITK